jgi:outer membrane protein TolC
MVLIKNFRMNMGRTLFICFLIPVQLFAQQKNIDYFVNEGLKNNPNIAEINNLQQYFQIQNEFITAQNKKPQVNFTADYLLVPYLFDNGRPVSVTPTPSSKAYGYDAALSNGGLYAAQLNVTIPLFNTATIKRLYEQNKIQSEISAYSRKQIEHDIKKAITDQYIVTYQFQQQTGYLQKIIDQLQSRKPLVEALVKKGLLQQNDFLLLDIQLIANRNDLTQLQFACNNGLALIKNLSLISDTVNYILERPAIFETADPVAYNYIQKFKLDSLNLVAQQNVFNTKYRPQVSLLGTTGLNAADIRTVPHNVGLSAGVHLSIPISDGHQRKLYQRQNSVLLTNQQLYLNTTALLQQNNIRNAKQQIEQWRQTIEMAKEPIRKQELLLDIIKDKVIKGQVTVMDYINALQEYAVLQKNKAIAETNLLLYISQYNYYNW